MTLRPLLAVVGVAVLFTTLGDALWTTLSVSTGSGPLSGRVAAAAWRAGRSLRRHDPSSRLAVSSGLLAALVPLFAWIVLVWLGWSLIFASSEGAVVSSATGIPAPTWERAYFAGYTLFTLGNGEFRPGGGGWQLATVAAAFSGLALVSIAITHMVMVTSAASEGRLLALTISDLGASPQEILERHWDGTRFGLLPEALGQLSARVNDHVERHRAYPTLHYFHSPDREAAASAMLAVLDETLNLLEGGIAWGAASDAQLDPARRACDRFIALIRGHYASASAITPPPCDLTGMRAHGLPVVSDSVFAEHIGRSQPRRRLLHALVTDDGWPWPEERGG